MKNLTTRVRLNYLGIIFGFFGYCVALTPSLMPRPAIFMGIVAGMSFAVLYGIGVAASYVVRRHKFISEPGPLTKKRAWITLASIAPFLIIITSLLARYWQNDQRALLDQPPIENTGTLVIVLIATVMFVFLLAIGRCLRWVYKKVQIQVNKLSFLPPYIGVTAAIILSVVIVITSLNGVLQRTAIVALDNIYSTKNNSFDPTFERPSSSLRSGSPDSAASWEGLGREGRRFVASGPTATEITEFNGKPAKEPIRAYAGIGNADDRETRVGLVISELERTKAFDRKVLAVVIPTGSGWIEAETIAALEYMHSGDTATVAAQYSSLPSALALLIDQGDATAMGRELLHAVENKLHTMPEASRPKLVVYGLSLGSFGGQSDFTGEGDFARRIDAGLFVGTPGFSEPWRTFTENRDAGSPQVEPIYQGASTIKFVTNSSDVLHDTNAKYKIIYFQYATDPIVWFDASLIYKQPDWTREEPGRGVSPHLRWFPVITFLQVAADQLFSMAMPGSNGHDYSHDTVAPLAAVTKPTDWSAAKSLKLQHLISTTNLAQGKSADSRMPTVNN